MLSYVNWPVPKQINLKNANLRSSESVVCEKEHVDAFHVWETKGLPDQGRKCVRRIFLSHLGLVEICF